jgi:plasmid replication initiation protein
MFSKILNLIAETKNKFTIIDVENLMQLRSKHSVRMIQLLEMIKGFGVDIPKRKRYLLEDLNGMFGTEYSRLKEFERKILAPVKAELDDKSDLSFVYETIFEDSVKQGRPSAIGIVIDLIDNQRRQRRFFV